MTAITYPNLGLVAGYDDHEDGWGPAISADIEKLSVLVQAGVIDKVSTEPGSPTDGDVILLDETNPTNPNAVAAYVVSAWVYYAPLAGWMVFNRAEGYYESFDGTVWAEFSSGGGGSAPTDSIIVAHGDEATDIVTGTAVVTIRMPYAFTLTAVRASLTAASSSGIPTVDINEGGVTILSTKLTIDATEKTSTTASVPAVISDSAMADDAEITFDIDVAGTGAKGLKVYLIGHQ